MDGVDFFVLLVDGFDEGLALFLVLEFIFFMLKYGLFVILDSRPVPLLEQLYFFQ